MNTAVSLGLLVAAGAPLLGAVTALRLAAGSGPAGRALEAGTALVVAGLLWAAGVVGADAVLRRAADDAP